MMHPIRRALLRLRAVFGRRSLERDMQAEMREHLERATERYMARGMPAAEARLAAKREFGNVMVLQEEGRDARGARWVDELAGDLRFAFRYFARHKGTTAIIVTVLALGIGANTVIFSLFQSEFLRPAPAMPDDDALARIWVRERPTRGAAWRQRLVAQPELGALAARRDVFQDVAAWVEDFVVIGGDTVAPRTVDIQFVTPNFFGMLGVPLAAGQGFRQDAGDAAELTAILFHRDAEQMFGDAASAVGRQILVNEVPVHIVGVAPPRFQGPMRNMEDPVLWMPLSARAEVSRLSPRWLTDEPSLALAGRLAPGVSHERATALARQVVANALPDSAARVGMARTADVQPLGARPPGNEKYEMIFAMLAVGTIGVLILLVACTNVSSLMVASAVSRRHEIAVRLSLGASRLRLVRQLVTEATLLALAGSAIGLQLAWWLLTYSQKTEINGVTIVPDAGTVVFVVLLSVGTGILFGLSPALHAVRGGVSNALRESGTGASSRSRLQRSFVVAQIALSQPLLVLLGVMLSLVIVDYKPHSPEMSRRVITMGFHPVETGAPRQRAEAVAALIPRIAERPEVAGVVPEVTGFAIRGVHAADRQAPGARPDSMPTIVHVDGAAPGWFALVDVPIVLGRDVSLADTAAAEWPVVIGSDLARSLWGGANPVGRRLLSPPLPGTNIDSIAMTVVGVYDATVRLPGATWQGGAVGGDQLKRVYTAHGKQWRKDRILVRTHGPAALFLPGLRKFVRAEAPSLPVAGMMTLAQIDEQEYGITLRMSALAGAGGALALLLASLGLYGVVSLAVRQRTREIGIRLAVGAHPMRVARMFLASGVRASAVALALGLPLSLVALKLALAQGLVIAPQVNPMVIGVAIALILLAVASAATWIPARRAAMVDPASTLRME